MAQQDRNIGSERIVGLSKSAAVERVVDADESRDPDTVRAVLSHVTEDGVVTADGVDSAVTDASMILSTAETRVELASIDLDDAREAAGDDAAIGAVRSRLDVFEATVANANDRVESLGEELRGLSDWRDDPRSVYDVVLGLREVASESQALTAHADNVQLDIEEFERWLSNRDVRVRGVNGDVAALEQSLDGLEDRVEAVADAESSEDSADAAEDANDDRATEWCNAALRARVSDLLVEDVRAELADLRKLAPESDAETDGLDEAAADLADLDARVQRLRGRLDDLARSPWTDEYGARIESFEATLAAFEPPVSWGEVQAELDDARVDDEG
ncbi:MULTISPECIES: halo transducer protein [Haloferax]|uniref:Chromosome partition protein Smc n=1 Tax=Haloferax massiliensis TaxID=1476858 RepID=A0A0D6JWB7_9EURY|nr:MULTISPECIES: halo transducer protein [Haloferax]MDS0242477.1 halo transducer protein [Haloferax sp. S2CR25]MDS0445598.1 halo transducer protein [Haloferax sp. S2CR25-2]CQR52892.1 Chromosome partition protein Smc [Haloferax massiliensis]